MRRMLIGVGAMVVAASLGSQAQPQSKGGEDETGPYEVVEGWPRPWAGAGYIWGSQPGVFAESEDRIYILARGELKLPEKIAPTGACRSSISRAPRYTSGRISGSQTTSSSDRTIASEWSTGTGAPASKLIAPAR